MLFICWIEYPSMMICLHKDEEKFYCTKYTSGGKKVAGALKSFESKEALKAFLISLPSPPLDYIEEVLAK